MSGYFYCRHTLRNHVVQHHSGTVCEISSLVHPITLKQKQQTSALKKVSASIESFDATHLLIQRAGTTHILGQFRTPITRDKTFMSKAMDNGWKTPNKIRVFIQIYQFYVTSECLNTMNSPTNYKHG
jgi:hypothetical protein